MIRLSVRPASWRMLAVRTLSSTAPPAPAAAKPSGTELEATESPVERRVDAMKKISPHMVFGDLTPFEAPVLPDNPAEISALDPAHRRDLVLPNGQGRRVHIRQRRASVGQSPTNEERDWIITFHEEGELASVWKNPLMGWVSGSDPMARKMDMQLYFRTAKEAVYFAKKKGWNFVVEKPILRGARRYVAAYQDNFLPKSVVSLIQKERTNCTHWERTKSGSSHYVRPLKYHGDGLAPQYGPNPDQELDPYVESVYKRR